MPVIGKPLDVQYVLGRHTPPALSHYHRTEALPLWLDHAAEHRQWVSRMMTHSRTGHGMPNSRMCHHASYIEGEMVAISLGRTSDTG